MGVRVIAWGDIKDFPGEVCPDRTHSSRQAAIDCGRALQRKAWCAQKWGDCTDSAGFLVVDMLGAKYEDICRELAVNQLQNGDLTEAMKEIARAAILIADKASDE